MGEAATVTSFAGTAVGVRSVIAAGDGVVAAVEVRGVTAPGSVVTTTLSISGAIWDRRSDMAEGMLSRSNQSRNTSTRKTTICHSHLHPQPAGLGS